MLWSCTHLIGITYNSENVTVTINLGYLWGKYFLLNLCSLNSNEFGDRGAEDLAEAMKTMTKLQVLDLG